MVFLFIYYFLQINVTSQKQVWSYFSTFQEMIARAAVDEVPLDLQKDVLKNHDRCK